MLDRPWSKAGLREPLSSSFARAGRTSTTHAVSLSFHRLSISRAVHQVAKIAQVVSEVWFGQRSFLVRHGWDALEQVPRELYAVLANDAGRLMAALVIREALAKC